MQNWLNYHHLLYFKVIAETGSLARASEVLRVGQSALSMQLKLLEDRLQQRLFDRKQKKLVLTEAGQLALEYAREIFGLGNEMLDTLRDGVAEGHPSRIQVGVEEGVPHFAATALLKLAMAGDATLPSVTHGSADTLVSDLLEHRLDLLLLLEAPGQKDKKILYSKKVLETGLMVLASPVRAKPKGDLLRGLAGLPLLLPSPLSRHRHEIERVFHQNELPLNMVLETDEPMLLKNMAAADRGVTFLPEAEARDMLRAKTLVSWGTIPASMELWLVGAKRKLANPLAEKLLDEGFVP